MKYDICICVYIHFAILYIDIGVYMCQYMASTAGVFADFFPHLAEGLSQLWG